ncbi:MAG TPA: hypothetical protein GX002_08955 [Clostridiales bacterium]|nr:hypothetical protein [Clostridiales bacterium]
MMQERLRKYVDSLFKDVPLTKSIVELKEEMIQNLYEKYQDLLKSGKTEETAFNNVISGIGDVSSLIYDMDLTIKELSDTGIQKSAAFTSVAVMVYIFSLIPIILSLQYNRIFYGLVGFIAMIMLATGILIYNNLKKQKFYRTEETIVAEFKEWQTNKYDNKVLRISISFALWSIIAAIYFIVSFTTYAWSVSWIIFLAGIAIEALINVFLLIRR